MPIRLRASSRAKQYQAAMHRIRTQHRLIHVGQGICLVLLAIGLAACQPQGLKDEEAAARQDVRLAQLEDALDRKNTQVMALELQLLEKRSEIEKLSATQEQAIQEVVRVTAKLRSRSSKAETVADLAEVKLALDGLQARKRGAIQRPSIERARQYVTMSEEALESGNFDGASYLIRQAKASIRVADFSSDERAEDDSDTTVFPEPVLMTVTRKSNVRAGPGLDKQVLYQLDQGRSVSATGYQGLWVRIDGSNGSTGWIHYSLLQAKR